MKYVSRERKYTELYIIAYKKVEAQQMAYKADYGYMQLVFNIFFVHNKFKNLNKMSLNFFKTNDHKNHNVAVLINCRSKFT